MKTQLYEPNPSLRVGHVVEVSGNTIKVELDVKITELSRSVDGVSEVAKALTSGRSNDWHFKVVRKRRGKTRVTVA